MMEKQEILEQLRKRGFRITRQRELLVDIILEEDCTCCKELYYRAAREDPGIGVATVYRMVNVLEEIGAIRQERSYKLCPKQHIRPEKYLIEMEDQSVVELSAQSLKKIIEAGMDKKKVKNIFVKG